MKIPLRQTLGKLHTKLIMRKYKHVADTAALGRNVMVYNPDNLIMDENTNIDGDATIMNTRARFIMRKNSGAAFGLTVITGGHMSLVGKSFKEVTNADKDRLDAKKYDRDVVVDEDVWIGARSILLSGCHVKRGAVIGGGSVVRSSVPPYAIVAGNPAKVVGFRFTPEEILEHEISLYEPADRIPLSVLEKNYRFYFESRLKEINNFLKICNH